MSILKKCENCTIETGIEDYCYYCDNYKFSKHEFSDDKFIPKERLVRQEMLDKECKEAFYAGMQQAYFDIGTKIENDLKNLIAIHNTYIENLKNHCFQKSSKDYKNTVQEIIFRK